MPAIRWVLAGPALLLFTLCVVGNWSLLVYGALSLLRGREAKSMSAVMPLLGPIFGIVFFLTAPVEGLARWWWLAPLIEPTWLLGAWILLTWPFVDRSGMPGR